MKYTYIIYVVFTFSGCTLHSAKNTANTRVDSLYVSVTDGYVNSNISSIVIYNNGRYKLSRWSSEASSDTLRFSGRDMWFADSMEAAVNAAIDNGLNNVYPDDHDGVRIKTIIYGDSTIHINGVPPAGINNPYLFIQNKVYKILMINK